MKAAVIKRGCACERRVCAQTPAASPSAVVDGWELVFLGKVVEWHSEACNGNGWPLERTATHTARATWPPTPLSKRCRQKVGGGGTHAPRACEKGTAGVQRGWLRGEQKTSPGDDKGNAGGEVGFFCVCARVCMWFR